MTEDHGRLVTLPWSRWLGTCKVEPNEGLIKGLLHVPMSTEGKMSLGRKRVGGTGEGIALRCGALRCATQPGLGLCVPLFRNGFYRPPWSHIPTAVFNLRLSQLGRAAFSNEKHTNTRLGLPLLFVQANGAC